MKEIKAVKFEIVVREKDKDKMIGVLNIANKLIVKKVIFDGECIVVGD